MPKSKKPNIFEQRRRQIDEASGWAQEKPKPKPKTPVKPPKKRSY